MQRCVIIGGGQASAEAAFNLRKEGWAGEIILISSEAFLPYHRPPLSKAYLTGETSIERLYIKPPAAYEKAGIEVRLASTVAEINPQHHSIKLDSGKLIQYNKLILCTGCSPNKLNVPGADLENIFYIRTLIDIDRIAYALENMQAPQKVVLIGGGYLGLETAAVLNKLGHKIVILERNNRVLERVSCPLVSQYLTQLHRSHGVEILTNKSVTAIEGKNKVQSVICCDGTVIKADMIIIGIGSKANSDLAKKAGLLTDIESIVVNEQCQTSESDIYAAGDCTKRFEPISKQVAVIESVPNAIQQAKIASTAICHKALPDPQVPWFWSDQYECKLQIVGLNNGYDTVIYRDYNNDKKSAWYIKLNKLIAVDCINCPSDFHIAKTLIKNKKNVQITAISDLSTPLNKIEISHLKHCNTG